MLEFNKMNIKAKVLFILTIIFSVLTFLVFIIYFKELNLTHKWIILVFLILCFISTLINLILSSKTESKDLLIFNIIILIVSFIIGCGIAVSIVKYDKNIIN
jgi:ABC-type multidrug transport system permease subunit